ncbi:MAG TPA: hypothetical protein VK995_00205, partial [Oceanipulchritudo sp.]|nr:hypothetical protein [Oceanipulchritudo sp.]
VLESDPDEHELPRNDVPTVVRMSGSGREFVLTREPSWEPCGEACVSQVAIYSSASGAPVGKTLMADGCVEAAAFSPDSNLLAVGIGPPGTGSPGRVEIRNRMGLRIKSGEIELPSGPASLAWNPLGEEIAVLCRSGEILIIKPGLESVAQWSTASASPRSRINPMVAYTPDGLTLVSLGPDGAIEIRESSSGDLRHPPMESLPDGFWSFALSRDSRYMVTATINGAVAGWDLERGTLAGGVLQHPSWVYRCHFSPNQNYLVTASHDGKVRLWDWRSGVIVGSPMVHPSEVYDAVFTPDDRWLLTACRDGNVRVWEPLTGQLLAPPVKVGQQAFNIEITGDGSQAVIGTLGKDVVILSLAVLQEKSPFTAEELCLVGEVISGCIIQQGSIRDLTTSEWMERYERIRVLHKDAFQAGHGYGLKKLVVEKTAVVPEVVRFSNPEQGD